LSVTIKQRPTKENIEADNTWNVIEAVFEEREWTESCKLNLRDHVAHYEYAGSRYSTHTIWALYAQYGYTLQHVSPFDVLFSILYFLSLLFYLYKSSLPSNTYYWFYQ